VSELSELDELERRINDLRAFEREYRSRLIAYHRDRLHELVCSPGVRGTTAIQRRINRIGKLAKAGDAAAAAREERALFVDALALVAAGDPLPAELATAALAAAQIEVIALIRDPQETDGE
jgi:hypothetical protein